MANESRNGAADAPEENSSASNSPEEKPRRRSTKKTTSPEAASPAEQPGEEAPKPRRRAAAKKTAPEAATEETPAPKPKRAPRKKAEPAAEESSPPVGEKTQAPAAESSSSEEEEASGRRRTRRRRGAEPVASSDAPPPDIAESSEGAQAESQAAPAPERRDDGGDRRQRGQRQDDQGGDDRRGGRKGRRNRNKNKGGGGGGGQQQQQQQRNDHPGEPFDGMLELIGDKKFGFIREFSTSLTKGDNDPFMPPPLIQKYNLRDGVALKGVIKPGRKGAWQVTEVTEVMGRDPEEWKETADFDDGVVIYPDEKLNLVTAPSDVSMRIIELVAPFGKGQRALIVAPPRAGKTVILKGIAAGLAKNHEGIELVALLIDERPEEVTDFRRTTAATVFASSNDFGEDNHVRVATLAFEYCRRLVELGKDVVLLLDSLTRLGRTFNLWGGNSGRTMSGGLDARALLMPRKIFGSARNIENGGSLTIIATALIETGSRMDDVIFEEFKGTGNAEVVLDRELADKRIYPAINLRKSGTRNEERLLGDMVVQHHMLLRVLNSRHPVEAMQALLRHVMQKPTTLHLLNELIPEQV
ncbi:hypothetical protein BH23BAC4_BH23BAC4_16040 [soil metagenome]